MRRLVFVVAFALVGGAACSLFVSTDDLQDGETTTNSDSGGGDTITLDSGNDAISDAGTDAFDANTPFCTSHPGHTFCADFDESTDAAAGWTGIDVGGGGAFALSLGTKVSAPASLVASDPNFSSGAEGEARLALNLNQVGITHVHAEADVQICDLSGISDDAGYIELFKLGRSTDVGGGGIELKVGQLGGYVDENFNVLQYPFAQSFPASEWTHVALDIVIGAHGSYTVTLNGAAIAAVDVKDADVPNNSYDRVLFGLYSIDAPACISFFDNFLLDVN